MLQDGYAHYCLLIIYRFVKSNKIIFENLDEEKIKYQKITELNKEIEQNNQELKQKIIDLENTLVSENKIKEETYNKILDYENKNKDKIDIKFNDEFNLISENDNYTRDQLNNYNKLKNKYEDLKEKLKIVSKYKVIQKKSV